MAEKSGKLRQRHDTKAKAEATPEPEPAAAAPTDPLVKDVYGRMVPNRISNRPFTPLQNWQKWKAEDEARRADIARQRAERLERIARGEDGGPEIIDPTEPRDITLADVLKVLVFVLVAVALAGQFFVGSPVWGLEGKWTEWRTYAPQKAGSKVFTETELKAFNGKDPLKPIYLALDGEVYDVTAGRHTYGPGGSYHHFAGVDHARAFVTGCFQEHTTHDTRGFTTSDFASLDHWKKFFREHEKYYKIGTVSHPPIDPASPIPTMCDKTPKGDRSFGGKKPIGPVRQAGYF